MSERELSPEEETQLARARAVGADLDALVAEDSWCHLFVPRMTLNWGRMFLGEELVARKLRGRLMRTHDGFEAEVTAALQFPEYYETYPNAFDECLGDLDWLPTTTGYLLLLTRAEEVLVDQPRDAYPGQQLSDVVTSFARAASTFAAPVTGAGDDDRPALSFDLVLLTDHDHEADVRRRWREAGAPLAP